jgi:uncharacterized membrane protein
MKKATFGLDENVASALSYITCLSGIIFFLNEKENKFVRFNALQSILLWLIFIALEIVLSILSFIPGTSLIFHFVLFLLVFLMGIIIIFSSIYLIVNAYKGVKVKLPFISNIAEKKA